MLNSKYQIFQPFIFAVAIALGMFFGYSLNNNHSFFGYVKEDHNSKSSLGNGRIEDILRTIENNYVDGILNDNMIEESIKSLISNLDPFSVYMNPTEFGDYNDKIKGIYRGVGIESIFVDDTLYVNHVTKDSPAYEAGIRPGFIIYEIEGDTIVNKNRDIDYVSNKIKEVEGDYVDLVVQGIKKGKEKISVAVKELDRPSATTSYLIDDGIGYIKISRFSANTYDQVFMSLEKIFQENDEQEFNLILDLRNNPGGYLPQALRILSQLFQEKGHLLTYTRGKHRSKKEHLSTGRNFYDIGEIAVLVNDYSASASEVVAGALQDWDRGIIIGEKTYGKGLVQEVFPLKNGGGIKLTVARYYTPSGRQIQKPYHLFNDSIYQKDTLFTSMVYQRELDNNGGIYPDVKSDYRIPEYDKDYISLAVKHVLSNVEPFSINTLKQSSEDRNTVIEPFFEEMDRIQDLSIDRKKMVAELIYSWYGALEYNKYVHVKDKSIIKALEILSYTDPFKKLVSNEF